MKKSFSIWHLLTLLALVLPALYLAAVWTSLPDQIPTHWGPDGRANGFTSRANIWLVVLGLPLGVYLLLAVLPRLDPKKRLDAGSANFQKLRLVLVALLGGLACFALYAAQHPGTQPERGMNVIIGLFFAFMGNYLSTVRPNYFIGFRTPWTLEHPLVWERTHRVAGRLFFWSGLLVAAVSLFTPTQWSSYLLMGLVLGTAVVSYGYSYVSYQQLRNSVE